MVVLYITYMCICKFVLQLKKLKGRYASIFTVMIMTVVVFIFLPSTLFWYIESWTYVDSLYYSILSLSTVGFGDFTTEGEREVEQKLGTLIWIYRAFVWLWLIFGICIITASYAMLVEYIGAKSKKLRNCKNCYKKLITSTTPMSEDQSESNISNRSTPPQPLSPHPPLRRTSPVETTLTDNTLLSLHELEHNEQMEMLSRYEENINSLWDNFGTEYEPEEQKFPNTMRQELEIQLAARKTHENRQFNGINNFILGQF